MIIKFVTYSEFDSDDNLISFFITGKVNEDENKKTLAEIYDLPEDQKVTLTPGPTVTIFKEPERVGSDEKETTKRDMKNTKIIECALNDLKNRKSSLYRDLYCQFYPKQQTKETFIAFGIELIESILAYYGPHKMVSSFFRGKRAADVTATVHEKTDSPQKKGRALNHFVFFPIEKMWKDPDRGFGKNDEFIYPELDGVTMHDLDKEFVLSDVVPPFYKTLTDKNLSSERTHDLFAYSMECKDITGKYKELRKIIRKIF